MNQECKKHRERETRNLKKEEELEGELAKKPWK